MELGIDPGSKHTGIAVFSTCGGDRRGLYAVELTHRGGRIRDKLTARSAHRRGRRTRNLRYRSPRYNNRTKAPGRLAPSLRHRVETTMSWTNRISRWALWRSLDGVFPTVHTASGGRTNWNRQRTGLPKTHTLDALCVGRLDTISRHPSRTLTVTATGRGSYARTRTDKYGFPRLRLPRRKQFFGYQTGDLVRAVVPTGKHAGTHTGRIAVRTTGRFNIRTTHGLVQGIRHQYLRLLQRADGYSYTSRREGSANPA